MLKGKSIILGVTGSISAYKAIDLASKLTQAGALVDVLMTKSAMEFVNPLSFGSLTRRPVITEMFGSTSSYNIEHISLSDRAEIIVICPATANIIAKIASGLADDILSSTILATAAPVIIAPAMNYRMYENVVTQENINKLKSRGFIFVGPASGRLATGAIGKGRLIEISEVLGTISQVLGRNGDLAGKSIVITAGGTREPIDPVRFIGNHSSGKMGYAIAEVARDRGAKVTLISAPTSLPVPAGTQFIPVQTAMEMRDAVVKAIDGVNVLIMAAAVADFTPKTAAPSKIKKASCDLMLDLVKTPDILSELAEAQLIKVGFAAETEELINNATKKLHEKHLNMIVANNVAQGTVFGSDTNEVTIISNNQPAEKLTVMPKIEVANIILNRIIKIM
ncbi:MAG: bifunctional phosphopantothenoylcysteine decarboxylase/phosphopantothenate--cysteine ligase CoaBC [Chloroflexi bacterium]|nr:bifunctional phosphopantothenoylcysteine decarboxylase/phosphopantothenate--cysteine ligase CoaBC [Chloroflexota bacterium]